MEKEPGDDYIRRFAAFLRSQERQLAGGGVGRPRQNTSSSFSSVLGWIGIDVSSPSPNLRPPPTILSIDLHHLFYLLIRLEDFGIDVGSLDVKLQSNSRPVSYASLLAAAKDGSDTLSIASIATSISKLSIGSGWWGIGQPRKPDLDLKYIYSCFTILPALSLCQSDLKVIAELATDPPTDTAIPLDAFKFLQRLELLDIDPRNVLGWDRLSESLHSLTVKRSGVEDVSDILIDAVADDEVRRHGKGGPTVGRLRQPSQRYPSSRSRKFPPLGIPTPISEHVAEDACSTEIGLPEESQATKLSKHKWRLLKHLSLADNALTFLPTAPLPHLASLTHLDLSSNLLVSVPPGLSELYNLVSLNLSDNMIDSVLGIYTQLGQILILNLSKNRLESLCGLERLLALERVDVKHNRLADTGEVGRLAILPNITEVSVEGNPFTHLYQDYRVRCFDHFANEGKSISVDGTGPSFFESRNVKVVSRPEVDGSNTTVSRRKSTALVPASPPVVSIGATVPETPSKRSRQSVDTTNFVSTNTQQFLTSEHLPMSPSPSGVGINSPLSDTASSRKVKAAKRKLKRIVDLDGNQIADGSASDNTISSGPKPKYRAKARHARGASEGVNVDDAFPGSFHPSHAASRFDPPPKIEATSTTMAARIPEQSSGDTSPPHPTAVRRVSARALKSNPRRGGHTRQSTEGNLASPTAARLGKASTDGRRLSPPLREPLEPGIAEHNDAVGHEDEGEKYRAKIEGLRSEVGDDWLKVLSGGFAAQIQNGKRKPALISSSPQVHSGGSDFERP